MKIIQGEFFFAWSNKSRTREAPTPTNISTKSEPEIEKNGTPASPATALASRVLPVPGGPTSSTPLGIRAPSLLNLSGDLRNSTTSSSSSFSSSAPATSSKVVFRLSSFVFLIFALPKFISLPIPPPPIRFIMNSHATMKITTIKTVGIISNRKELSLALIRLYGICFPSLSF